jgi:hypothetical protein
MRSIVSTFTAQAVPVHLGHAQQASVGEVAPQLVRVGAFADQVELVVQVVVELVDHFERAQPARVGRDSRVEQRPKVRSSARSRR